MQPGTHVTSTSLPDKAAHSVWGLGTPRNDTGMEAFQVCSPGHFTMTWHMAAQAPWQL